MYSTIYAKTTHWGFVLHKPNYEGVHDALIPQLKTLLVLAVALQVGGVVAVEPLGQVRFLNCDELTESSGVCFSQQRILWTHNDSGDQPRLFAFDPRGKLLAIVEVSGAKAVDWEDICYFQRDGTSYLAVGDVGDNQSTRDQVQIYLVKEPELDAQVTEPRRLQLPVEAVYSINYPSGPVNCEALAYDPVSQEFLLATKELLRSRFFRIDARRIQGNYKVTADLGQSVLFPLVTAADIRHDGQQLILCGYSSAWGLNRDGNRWDNSNGFVVELPRRRLGESICYHSSGNRLYLTSEFSPTPLFDVPVIASAAISP